METGELVEVVGDLLGDKVTEVVAELDVDALEETMIDV